MPSLEEPTSRLAALESYVRSELAYLPANLTFHNADHTLDLELGVVARTRYYCQAEGVCAADTELATAAAYLHDIGHTLQSKDHEKIGAAIAAGVLPQYGYDSHDVRTIKRLVLATLIPTHPVDLLEQIICDADVDNLGRADFFEKTHALQAEMGVKDRQAWYLGTYAFMQNHQYYTATARAERDRGKQNNVKLLAERIEHYGRPPPA
ncbi:MAG: HD domain-containing protein [Nanoarchaeota archaeon]